MNDSDIDMLVMDARIEGVSLEKMDSLYMQAEHDRDEMEDEI